VHILYANPQIRVLFLRGRALTFQLDLSTENIRLPGQISTGLIKRPCEIAFLKHRLATFQTPDKRRSEASCYLPQHVVLFPHMLITRV
jgi:hypothetical protein